jgi:SAM-dependent methyltransferase
LRQIVYNPFVSAKFFPLQGESHYAVIHRASDRPAGADLPVPPKELWEGYGDTEADYLACGRADMAAMLDILRAGGARPEELFRVLEFGCAAGRMLRFYPYTGDKSEIWGVDIKARHIVRCQQHLPPPFRFATTTTAPHLPFEDNYFDLVYCGSVFTHIGDLADAWFLELRRVLRRGGHAYITVHDKHSVHLLLTKYRDVPGYRFLTDSLRRLDEKTSLLSQDYACFSMGSEPKTQVFYDADYLVRKWALFATILSVTQEAYGYQPLSSFGSRRARPL